MKMFQFCHRAIGVSSLIYVAWFFYNSRNEFYSRHTLFLFIAFLIQLHIGIMTLLLRVPIFLSVVHQGFAVLILLLLLHIKFLISNAQIINR